MGTTTATQIEDWHWDECKLPPSLTFDLLTSNEIGDQDLSCTMHLPSLGDDVSSSFCVRVHTCIPVINNATGYKAKALSGKTMAKAEAEA